MQYKKGDFVLVHWFDTFTINKSEEFANLDDYKAIIKTPAIYLSSTKYYHIFIRNLPDEENNMNFRNGYDYIFIPKGAILKIERYINENKVK